MICDLNFNQGTFCIKGGITLYEVEIRATGTKYGISDMGVSPVGTLLATFSTTIIPVPFILIDQTAGGPNNVTGFFSGTFTDNIIINDTFYFYEDINIRYRVTDNCGPSPWVEQIVYADCIQPTGGISTNYLFDTSADLDDIGIFRTYLIAQNITNIIHLRIVNASAVELASCTYLVGNSPKTGPFINQVGWASTGPNDGNFATYLTDVLITQASLTAGTYQFNFDKKTWAIDNGYASSVDYDSTLTIYAKYENGNCSKEVVNEYSALYQPKQFAEFFAPFIGKQAAIPNPELNYDGNILVPCPNHGFSLRNGSYNSFISEIRVDLGRTGIIDETINSTNSSVFPLQPISIGAPTPDGCSGVPTDTPLIFYPALPYMLATGTIDDSDPDDWRLTVKVPYRIYCDFPTTYAGTLTTITDFDIYFNLSSINSGASWSQLSTYFLIARGDANIFGFSIQTEILGTIITFGFNVNPSYTGGAEGGAVSWAIDQIRVANQPGFSPSTYTIYDITADAFGTPDFPAAPITGTAAYPVGITHDFTTGAGIYKVFVEIETDNGLRASAETFVVLITF